MGVFYATVNSYLHPPGRKVHPVSNPKASNVGRAKKATPTVTSSRPDPADLLGSTTTPNNSATPSASLPAPRKTTLAHKAPMEGATVNRLPADAGRDGGKVDATSPQTAPARVRDDADIMADVLRYRSIGRSVTGSALAGGTTGTVVRRWMREIQAFAAAMAEAELDGRDWLEDQAVKLAIEGHPRVSHLKGGGQRTDMVRDPGLMKALLDAKLGHKAPKVAAPGASCDTKTRLLERARALGLGAPPPAVAQ